MGHLSKPPRPANLHEVDWTAVVGFTTHYIREHDGRLPDPGEPSGNIWAWARGVYAWSVDHYGSDAHFAKYHSETLTTWLRNDALARMPLVVVPPVNPPIVVVPPPITPVVVPEPASGLLVGLALVVTLLLRTRSTKTC